jgi:hypothetical protein
LFSVVVFGDAEILIIRLPTIRAATETPAGVKKYEPRKLFEKLSTVALAAYNAGTRFRALATSADGNAILDNLARLDELDRPKKS